MHFEKKWSWPRKFEAFFPRSDPEVAGLKFWRDDPVAWWEAITIDYSERPGE